MFSGEYQYNLDAKGRVFMPSKFRETLGDKFIVTKGLDHCLFVYSAEEWERIEKRMQKLPFTSKEARAFTRFFFSGAIEAEPDKQGRILLSQSLRDHAGLKKEVTFIGVSSRIEIWDKEKWDNYLNDPDINYETMAEKMVEFDLDL